MPRSRFNAAEWRKIEALNPDDFGLPKRRPRSAVIGTFNTLKLGSDDDDAKHWDYLTNICKRFDFLAVQEVLDDLSGLERLVRGMRGYELLVSDTTGKFPGARRGLTERLAFIYRPDRVRLDDLASDISYDRSWVLETLQQDRALWNQFFDDLDQRLATWKQTGKGSRPSISSSTTPAFLTFIRQPHCAAFSLINAGAGSDIPFLAINAHLLYGNAKSERKREFNALVQWLIYRAQVVDRMYHTNMILFGDLNLEFKTAAEKRAEIGRLRGLNQGELGSANAALVNFPLLSVHPDRQHLSASEQLFRTNARSSQTYDQIAFFVHPDEAGLPLPSDNKTAGQNGASGYDYGVFRFTDLVAQALDQAPDYNNLPRARRDYISRRVNSGFSDHLPAWTRIPLR